MASFAPPLQEAGHESVVVGGLHQLDDPAARELELRPAEMPGRLLGAHQEARAQDVADQGDHARHLPGRDGDVVEAVRDRHPPHYAPGPPAHASGARRAMRAFEASSRSAPGSTAKLPVMPALKTDSVQEIKDRLDLADTISEHLWPQKACSEHVGTC